MDLQSAIFIALIGVIAGFLGGMLGLGGAVVIIPALVMLMGYSQHKAQGTALIMMVLPVGALAAFHYYQKGLVDVKASLIMAAFFFVGGFAGAKVATHIPEVILRKVFSVLLVAIAVKMWLQK